MSLQQEVMSAMKEAMKAKDAVALESLRAIKSVLLMAQTEAGAKTELSQDEEIKIVQKLVKQRKDSAAIYLEQKRADLAEPELAQAEIIAQFLPAQLSEDEIEKVVLEVIAASGAQGMKDMGKVMGVVSGRLAGKADGKTISSIVKSKLI
ncbi:GatB/YqeY domain-containing protein [Cellulophaga sp. F20128]|uniref:GatB/YqeY domain-containing protein n=1 Tax=Cellulophaga sp. F20128 TaxID=2926413 RepID=UPI001FF2795B|nr:GatB/YqeY domain-containing protein [Cellulophaga sp. F20128]MCK0156087.1 GatB/YqeY domain-containing protein [Cellulophaga sp. F20128]